MGKAVIIADDPVTGKDKHNVAGLDSTPPPAGPKPYKGVGEFAYKGKMKTSLSSLVKIGGKAVAVRTSGSMLDPAPGDHIPVKGSNWQPTPAPNVATLQITDPIGPGRPSAGSGSAFVKAGGSSLLLDGDRIDTCDGTGATGNSSVSAKGQQFVTCSE